MKRPEPRTPAEREKVALTLAWNTWRRYLRGNSARGFLDEDDLRGAAMLGAAKALDRFDPARGVKFSSFAITYIRWEIREEARRQDYLSRELRAKVRALQAAGEKTPQWALPPQSLDELVDIEEGEAPDLDPIARAEWLFATDDTEVEALDRLEAETLWAWVACLPRRECQVLTRYYRENKTDGQIGAEMDRSDSRVHQLRDRGLAQLREWLTDRAVTTSAP